MAFYQLVGKCFSVLTTVPVTCICQLNVSHVPISLPSKLRPKTQPVARWVPCFLSGAWICHEHLIYAGSSGSLPEEVSMSLRAGSHSKSVLRPRLAFQVESGGIRDSVSVFV